MSFNFMYGMPDYCLNSAPPNPNGIPYHHHHHHHHHHLATASGGSAMVPALSPVTVTGIGTASGIDTETRAGNVIGTSDMSGSSTVSGTVASTGMGNPSAGTSSVSGTGAIPATATPDTGFLYQELPVMRLKAEHENRAETKAKKVRKRKPAGSGISRQELKRRRNAGEEYVTRKGKVIKKKEYQHIDCKCRLHCSTKVSFDVRKLIFDQYHALADWNNQTQFIVSSVTVVDVKGRKRRRKRKDGSSVKSEDGSSLKPEDSNPPKPEDPGPAKQEDGSISSRRSSSRIFYLTSKKIRVCKPVFLSTLGITNKRLDYALRHKAVPMTALATPDRRGKKGPPQNRTPIEVEDGIRAHISSLPKPTNTQAKPAKSNQNMSSELTMSKMYSLYKEQCQAHGITPASMWVYAKIYHSEFKLPQTAPKKDTPCKKCERTKVILRSGDEPGKIIQMLLKEHQETVNHDVTNSFRDFGSSFKDSGSSYRNVSHSFKDAGNSFNG